MVDGSPVFLRCSFPRGGWITLLAWLLATNHFLKSKLRHGSRQLKPDWFEIEGSVLNFWFGNGRCCFHTKIIYLSSIKTRDRSLCWPSVWKKKNQKDVEEGVDDSQKEGDKLGVLISIAWLLRHTAWQREHRAWIFFLCYAINENFTWNPSCQDWFAARIILALY